jgi:hypothetical protein
MRKALIIIALGIFSGTLVFGEDARIPKAKSGRSDTVIGFSFYPQQWDNNGGKADVPRAHVLTVGQRIEYSFTGYLSGVFDWSPTQNILSSTDDPASPAANGTYDIALGARFQIAGLNAPVKTEHFRLTAAPGVIIPFPDLNLPFWKVDADEKRSNNACGFGGSVSFDIDLSKLFFLNLYGEFYAYPIKNKASINHGWGAAFEIEPHFETAIANVVLRAGLPVSYAPSPEKKINGTGNSLDSHALSLSPVIALRVTSPLSILLKRPPSQREFSLRYTLPILGRNTAALHSVTLGITAFF